MRLGLVLGLLGMVIAAEASNSISGTISPASIGSGATMTLSGPVPVLVQSAHGSAAIGGTSATVSFGAASAGGDTIVVFTKLGGTTISSITDNQTGGSNTYTSVLGPTQWGVAPNPTDRWSQVFVAKNITGGGSLNITASLAGSSTHPIYLVALEYSGVDPVNPVNAVAVGVGKVSQNGAPATGNLTTSVANTKLVATSWDSNESYGSADNGSGFTTNSAAAAPSLTGGPGWANLTEDETAVTSGTWNATTGTAPEVDDWAIQLVALTPAPSQTVTADANANYTFINVSSGTYTVTPAKPGFAFSPVSQSVTVNGTDVTGVNFTATSLNQTYSVSGTISPASSGSGTSVALSGPVPVLVQSAHGSAATGSSSATISFGAASAAGDTIVVFTKLGGTTISSITDNQAGGSNTYTSVLGPTQWGVAPNPTDRWSQVFIAKNITSGGSLTITANLAGSSTHPIYLVALEYSGVDPVNPVNAAAVGTGMVSQNGAPATANLTTIVANAKLVATSWDSNESYPSTGNGTGFTTDAAASAASLTGGPGWANLTEDETAAAPGTWNASTGTALEVDDWAIQLIALTPAPSQSVTADANGNYAFDNVNNGTYTATPVVSGSIFSPVSQSVTVNGANVTGVNFAATPLNQSYSISGTISPATSGSGAALTLSGPVPVLVQSARGPAASGSTSATASFGVVSAAGDTIVVFTKLGGTTISSITDNQTGGSNTYTSVLGPTQWGVTPNPTDRWSQVFVAKNIRGGTNLTLTATLASGSTHPVYLVGLEYSGVDPVNPINTTSVGTGKVSQNGAPTTGNLTTTVANTKLIATSWDSNESYSSTGNGTDYATDTAASAGSLTGGPGWANLTEDETAATPGTWNASTGTALEVDDWAIQLIALTPAPSQSVIADANGNYAFGNVNNRTYTVTPSKSGLSYSPVSQSVTVNGADITGVNFTMAADQCIYALDKTAPDALELDGTATLSANSCGIVVDSSSSTALNLKGTGSLTAKYINIVGGYAVSSNSGTISPTPQSGSAYQPDPLSFYVRPSSSACDYTNVAVSGGSTTLSPGTYCNGISVSGSVNVTFQPGTYILMGGGLKASGSSTLNGSGVTFFLTAGLGYAYGPASVSGTVVMNLTAPTSGPHQGLLFWQDADLPSGQVASSVDGTSSSTLQGVFYFATTSLSFAGTPATANGSCVMVVADRITLVGKAVLKDNDGNGVCPALLPPIGVSVMPGSSLLHGGQTQQFQATVTNTVNTALTWSITPDSAGSISANGLYTAPATISMQQTVTVTAASRADPTKSASATVALIPPESVSVTPPNATLYAGQMQQFAATVLNTSNTAVTWSISPGLGSISASGLYAAPASISTRQMVTVTVTSQADPTKSASASVTLIPPISVSIAPASATLHAGQTQQFSATVANTSNTAVTWSISPGTGIVSANGLYRPPSSITTQQTVTVTATSQADTTKFASAIVTLVSSSPNSAFTLSPRLAGPNVVGAKQTMTAVLMSGTGPGTTAISGATVQFTVTGPNATTGTAITDATGTATFIYTGANGGNDIVQASYSSLLSNESEVGWVVPAQPISTTTILGQFFPLDGSCCAFSASPGDSPAFTETFPTINFNPPSGSIPGNATVGVGTQPFTDVTLDKNGNFSGTIVAQGNGYQAWAGGLRAFQAVFTGSFIVANGGDAVISVYVDNAFVLGIGGGATRVSGSVNGAPQVTPFNQYPVMGALSTSIGGTSMTVHFPGPGTYPFELNFVEDGGGLVSLMMMTGTPGSNGLAPGVPSGGTLTLSPNSVQPQPADGRQSFTVIATDAAGNPVPNLNVSLVISLNDTQELSAVTDSSGTATFSYQNIEPGTDNVQAVAIISGMVAYSNIVSVPWTSPSGSGSGSPPPPTTPPDVPVTNSGWIGSPANGSTVSGLVPIVVASGTTIASGTLSYLPGSNPNEMIVLNASVSGSGQIGTFDTTTLPNGDYWIELDAVSTTGTEMVSLELVTVAGDLKPGRITSTTTDLVVPAKDLPISIERRYDSLNSGKSGDFGYGWSLGTTVGLETMPSNDVALTLGGERRIFHFTPQPISWLLPFLVTPAYTPEPGLHGTLTTTGDNCGGVLERAESMLVCDFGLTGTQYQPTGYIYTDAAGTQYAIAADGTLQSITDLAGNSITITANGITSTTGLSVPFQRDAQGRITQITDPLGNKYQYSYDANGNLASVTYPAVAQPFQFTYNSSHRLTGGTDPRGNPLPTTAYYADGRLQSVTDALGNTTSYAYNTATNTTTLTYPADANGNVGTATLAYDSYGKLLSSTDPLGHTTTNTYDANHNPISTTDPLNHTTAFTYDANGNRISVTYPKTSTSTNTTSTTAYNQYSEPTQFTDQLGNVRTVQYDSEFFPKVITDSIDGATAVLDGLQYNSDGTKRADALGYDLTASPNKATQYTYDSNGNLASATDPLGRQTFYSYDSLGHLLSVTPPLPSASTDPASATTTYRYDALGHVVEIDAPLGRVTKYQYDSNGNKIAETDAVNRTTSYQYDALNRLILTTYPTNPVTTESRTYDFRGNPIDLKDQAGHIAHRVYDLAGRLISVTTAYGTPDASTSSYTYYDDGRKKTETDALGHTTTYSYDEAGRVIATADQAGNTTSYAYDDANNRIATTDANSHTTQFQYDSRRRLRKQSYADGTAKIYGYDTANNLTSIADEAGATVQYTFDNANQFSSVIQLNHPDPSHNTYGYGYDNDGNLNALTDANGHTTQKGFDLLSQLSTETLPAGGPSQVHSYDAAGNLLSLQDFNGKTTTYTYDALNRLTGKIPDVSLGDTGESFTYTPTGQIASMTDASGTTTYTYDNADRLKTKATPEGTLNYTYDATGNLTSLVSSNPNGASVSYTYDGLNRLSTVVDNHLSAGQNTTAYTYDPASNVATVTYPNGLQSSFGYDVRDRLTGMPINRGSTALASYTYQLGPTGNRQSVAELSGRAVTWSYDGIYRLTNETVTNDPNSKNGAGGYGLDPVGNRLTQSATLPGISSGTFSFDANDRLSTETYDNNGNTLTSGGKIFKYDFENRLKSVNNGAISLIYDGEGNRVAKNAGGVATQYLVDDRNPTGLPQAVEELVNGSVHRSYTYGLNRISQNQLVNGTWQTSFYGYDGGGSVRLLTDTSGAVTDTYDYDAFGNLVNSTGSTSNNYLYRREQFDLDLGLYYLRARYYNPLAGRFLTRDPEPGDPSDPATLHKYLYARHDPVNWADPTGRQAATEEALVIRNIPLSAVVIGGLELVAQAITCLYDFDASAVQGVFEHAGETNIAIRRIFCAASVTGQQPGPGPAPERKPGILPSNCPPEQQEPTPSNPGNKRFDPIRGSPCKINTETGEVWCKDQLHKDHWEVYKSKRDWEKQRQGQDNRDRSVWENGCLRQKF